MKKITQQEWLMLYGSALKLAVQNRHLRLGQCLFNLLYDEHPDLANSVRNTENDPFYNDEIIIDFYNSIVC